MEGFTALLQRYPTDPFVNRYYLAHFAGYNLLPLYDRQLPRYEALVRSGASDPARRYLYAIAWQKRDPRASTATLEELILWAWRLGEASRRPRTPKFKSDFRPWRGTPSAT